MSYVRYGVNFKTGKKVLRQLLRYCADRADVCTGHKMAKMPQHKTAFSVKGPPAPQHIAQKKIGSFCHLKFT